MKGEGRREGEGLLSYVHRDSFDQLIEVGTVSIGFPSSDCGGVLLIKHCGQT